MWTWLSAPRTLPHQVQPQGNLPAAEGASFSYSEASVKGGHVRTINPRKNILTHQEYPLQNLCCKDQNQYFGFSINICWTTREGISKLFFRGGPFVARLRKLRLYRRGSAGKNWARSPLFTTIFVHQKGVLGEISSINSILSILEAQICQNLPNFGINYQPQLDSWILSINSSGGTLRIFQIWLCGYPPKFNSSPLRKVTTFLKGKGLSSNHHVSEAMSISGGVCLKSGSLNSTGYSINGP